MRACKKMFRLKKQILKLKISLALLEQLRSTDCSEDSPLRRAICQRGRASAGCSNMDHVMDDVVALSTLVSSSWPGRVVCFSTKKFLHSCTNGFLVSFGESFDKAPNNSQFGQKWPKVGSQKVRRCMSKYKHENSFLVILGLFISERDQNCTTQRVPKFRKF